jgi:predicted nucleic-acid-binding protein
VIGLDTNVLVRYLVRDDEPQHQVAKELIRTGSVMLDSSVLLETEWVLRGRYKLKKGQIVSAFDLLLSTSGISFDNETVIEIALHLWKNSAADFADCLFVARYMQGGCEVVATLDRKASLLPGTRLL